MAEYVKDMRSMIGTKPLIVVGSTIISQDEEQRVLLQLRSDTKEWGLPGGALEPGETLLETARREFSEETGLSASSFDHLYTLSGEDFYFEYPNGDEVYNVIAVFSASGTSGDIEKRDGESIALKYFSIDQLPDEIDVRAQIILEKFMNEY